MLSLGDSFSCGEGVGVRLEARCTWSGLLAGAVGAEQEVLAVAGATSAQVRETQLPIAIDRAPSWVTLFAGLNDVFRPGFDADRARDAFRAMVAQLGAQHHGVLVLRLHDPSTILPVPARLRRALQARIALINDAIDAAATPEVIVVDLGKVEALRHRAAWAVDRLHPSAFGHLAIASAAANAIAAADTCWPPATVRAAAAPTVPTRRAECRWVVRHGVPWIARRARMVGGVVATMVADDGERSVRGG